MTVIEKYASLRDNLASSLHDALMQRVRAIQNELYTDAIEAFTALQTDAKGRLLFSTKNLRQINLIRLLLGSRAANAIAKLTELIPDAVKQILGINNSYFDEAIRHDNNSIEQRARALVMARLGFDEVKKKAIAGGWLETLAKSDTVAQTVGEQMTRAIAAKKTLTAFQKEFKSIFTDQNGLGVLEQHFYTNTSDIYQQVDRTTQLIYADELKLNYAVYSGTIKNNTRDFCRSRVNKVFSRTEVASWASLSFAGKPKTGYNPFTDAGGHRCRHHLSWISTELARQIAPEKF